MSRFLSITLGAIALAVVFSVVQNTISTPLSATMFEEKKPVYRHIVLFKFEETATPEQIKGVVDAFAALPGKIDTIKDFEMGTNVSPEKHDKGFTHGFVVTFDDKEGLEEYLPHPAHKEFGAGLGGILKDVIVFDYVTK